MKKHLALLSLLALTACTQPTTQNLTSTLSEQSQQATPIESTFDAQNSTFTVDNQIITLTNGISETPIENSSALTETRYLGYLATGDLNGDDLLDHVFFISQTTGGSGTFFYVVAALQNTNGYTTTNAFFVGDRITPQSIEIRNDTKEIRVYYAGHQPDEPMANTPTAEKVLLLKTTKKGVLEGLMQ